MMKKNNKEVEEGKPFAFLGIFLTVIGFIIVILTHKKNKYAMFYAKQGLVLFIAWVIVWVVSFVLAFIPFVGWLVSLVLWIGILILWILGIIYSLSGEEKEIPIIGEFAKKFDI